MGGTKRNHQSQPRLQPAFDRSAVAHHDLSSVKPRRRKDGHHGSRSSNGAAFTNGKTKQTLYCCVYVLIHVL